MREIVRYHYLIDKMKFAGYSSAKREILIKMIEDHNLLETFPMDKLTPKPERKVKEKPEPTPKPKKVKIIVKPKPEEKEDEPIETIITRKPPTKSYLLQMQKAIEKYESDPEITHYTYKQLEDRKKQDPRYMYREKPDPKKMTPTELKQYKYESLISTLHIEKEHGIYHRAPDAEESELSKLMRYVPEKTDAKRDEYVSNKLKGKAQWTIGKYDIQQAENEYDKLQEKEIKESHFADLTNRENLRKEFKKKHLSKHDILPSDSIAEKYYTDSMNYIVPAGKTIKDLTQTQLNYCAIYTYGMMHGLITHESKYDLDSGKKLTKNDFTKEMKQIYENSSQDTRTAIDALNFNSLQPLYGPYKKRSVIKQAFNYGAGLKKNIHKLKL